MHSFSALGNRTNMSRLALIMLLLLIGFPVHAETAKTTNPSAERIALLELLNRESIPWLRVVDGMWCSDRTIIAIKADADLKILCYFEDQESGCRPLRASHKKDEICGSAGWSSPPPAWLGSLVHLIAASGLHIEPFNEGPGLLVRENTADPGEPYALLRIDGTWRLVPDLSAPDPFQVSEISSYGPWRLLDARSLRGQPLYAVITSRYSGGSQSGSMDTGLLLVAPVASGPLPVVLRKRIGTFGWSITPAERSRLIQRGVYHDMRARPHYEILLEPVFRPGILDFKLKRSALQHVRRWCEPGELKSKRNAGDSNCPIAEIHEVQALTGPWRFVDGGLRR